jgi:two-component system, LytTR family, response regulator
VPRPLNTLANRLDPALFFRASRQHLVNLRWIKTIESWFSGGQLLVLKGDDPLKVEVSRRQAQEFRERMAL